MQAAFISGYAIQIQRQPPSLLSADGGPTISYLRPEAGPFVIHEYTRSSVHQSRGKGLGVIRHVPDD